MSHASRHWVYTVTEAAVLAGLFMPRPLAAASSAVSIRRRRSSGFAVVERARPRPRHLEASLGVSYGGVAVVAAPGVRFTSVNIGVDGVSEMHRLF